MKVKSGEKGSKWGDVYEVISEGSGGGGWEKDRREVSKERWVRR